MGRLSEKTWLLYAVDRTAAPGRWTIVSLFLGALALFDYVLAYSAGHIESTNIAFCVVGILSIAVGIAVYVWEQTELFHHADRKIDNTVSTRFSPPLAIGFRPDYAASGYEIFKGKHGFGFWSRVITKRLFENPSGGERCVAIELRGGFFAGRHELRRSIGAKEAVNALRAKKVFRNELKIRLCSDILTDGDDAIVLQQSDYLASRSSNDISFRTIEIRSEGLDDAAEARTDVVYDGLSFFLTANPVRPVFRGYADSECSNQIGVSTIALTADGWLLLVDQLKGGIESPDLIAPSGSGSLDWSDLDAAGSGGDFWAWITQASSRELREELGIAPQQLPLIRRLGRRRDIAWMKQVAIRSAPIGFGGYLHRGGKPEFFFLAKLGCTLDEIRKYSAYSSEEAFLSQRCQVNADQRLDAFTADGVLRLIERNANKRDSFPLELGYAMLAELCHTRPEAVEIFLRS